MLKCIEFNWPSSITEGNMGYSCPGSNQLWDKLGFQHIEHFPLETRRRRKKTWKKLVEFRKMLARSRFLCCPSTQKELTETTNKMLFKINLRSSISLFVVLYGFVLVMFFFVLPIHLKSLMSSFSFILKQESKIVQGGPVQTSKESVYSRFYEEVSIGEE